MEELKSQGLVKSIGVSNYFIDQLDWLLETCTVKPSINQIEFHPYLQRDELVAYHKKHVSHQLVQYWWAKRLILHRASQLQLMARSQR